MSKGKVVIGTVAGLAIGAIAGVLFAPEKGSTTRKQIKDKSDDIVGKLKTKFDKVRDSLAQKSEGIKNEAEGLVDKGKEKWDDVKKDAEGLVDKGKEKWDDAKKDVKNTAADIKPDAAADSNQPGKFSFNDQ